MTSLPPEGVVIVAGFVVDRGLRASSNVNFPPATLPLQLSDAQVADSWEGQVAPNVPEYRLLETVPALRRSGRRRTSWIVCSSRRLPGEDRGTLTVRTRSAP